MMMINNLLTDKIQHYMLEEYLKDCEGYRVTKAVHVQCYYDSKPEDETKLASHQL